LALVKGCSMVSVSFVVGSLVFLPALVVSCDCMLNWTVARSFTLVDTVFTGRVERRLPNVAWDAVYIVKVDNVLMGCSVTAPNHVIVRTGRERSLCGVTLSVNETYLFSGWNSSISDGIRQQIGTDTANCQAVLIRMCYVNVPWSRVTTETLQILNQLNTAAFKFQIRCQLLLPFRCVLPASHPLYRQRLRQRQKYLHRAGRLDLSFPWTLPCLVEWCRLPHP
jgi:hypothetical protein